MERSQPKIEAQRYMLDLNPVVEKTHDDRPEVELAAAAVVVAAAGPSDQTSPSNQVPE